MALQVIKSKKKMQLNFVVLKMLVLKDSYSNIIIILQYEKRPVYGVDIYNVL